MSKVVHCVQVRDLDPNTIQARVDESNRLNYKMVKAKPQDAVAAALKAELDSFKEQLPLLQEVCFTAFVNLDSYIQIPPDVAVSFRAPVKVFGMFILWLCGYIESCDSLETVSLLEPRSSGVGPLNIR